MGSGKGVSMLRTASLIWIALSATAVPVLGQDAGNAPPPTEARQPSVAPVGAGTRSETTTGTSGSGQEAGNGAEPGEGPPDVLDVCGDIGDPDVHRHCVEKAEQ